MRITILAEDRANPERPDLKSDHGFALLAETEKRRILYDFGADGVLETNCRLLNVNIAEVDIAILSHGHYDHSGGLPAFLESNDKSPVYHGRGAFQPRWSISNGSPEDVGISLVPTENVVNRMNAVDTLIDREDFVILPAAPGHRIRPSGNASLLAGPEGNRLQDDFTDELTLVLRTDRGLVVVTGCSHRGILNIIDQVKTYCPECPIRALIGGFHLIDDKESDEMLQSIGSRLQKDLKDSRIITGHCTGEKSIKALSAQIGKTVESLKVGLELNF